MLNAVKHLGSTPHQFAEREILRLRAQNDTFGVACAEDDEPELTMS